MYIKLKQYSTVQYSKPQSIHTQLLYCNLLLVLTSAVFVYYMYMPWYHLFGSEQVHCSSTVLYCTCIVVHVFTCTCTCRCCTVLYYIQMYMYMQYSYIINLVVHCSMLFTIHHYMYMYMYYSII